jgi:uncharacterized membrane protein YbjE (DUF340 family)
MKSSIIILIIFATGVILGVLHLFPENHQFGDVTTYILYMLMFIVGVSIGCDKHIWQEFREMSFRVLLIPLTTIVGTAIGVLLYRLIFAFPNNTDLFAIGAGFGYYSLSSIVITKISGESMGIIALLANIIREVVTLVMAPVFVRYFGKIAPIAAGGATTSDTTLPMILKYSGKEYVFGSVVNGIVLTLLVPIFIAFIYGL